MKKRITAILLTAVLVLCTSLPVSAYSNEEKNTADALYQMGLFLGYGSSYGLDDSLTRYQGYILLIRMLGKEEEAKAANYTHPFQDVKADDLYVAYAYQTGLTKGVSSTSFGSKDPMNAQQFAVVCLRAIGYDDGAGGDFAYRDAKTFAEQHGVYVPAESAFQRGDCVNMFWSSLHATMKGSNQTLAEALIAQGVFTMDEWKAAERIQKNGISSGDETGEKTDGGNTGISSGGTEAIPSGTVPAAPTGLTAMQASSSTEKDGKIMGVSTAMEYSSTSDFKSAVSCTGSTITGLAAGTYYVRYKAVTATNTAASNYAAVVVPSGTVPAAPTGLTAVKTSEFTAKDGKILGVSTAMEYSSTSDFKSAVSCTGSTITGLAAGTYYVRYKAVSDTNTLASAITEVAVPAGEKSIVNDFGGDNELPAVLL